MQVSLARLGAGFCRKETGNLISGLYKERESAEMRRDFRYERKHLKGGASGKKVMASILICAMILTGAQSVFADDTQVFTDELQAETEEETTPAVNPESTEETVPPAGNPESTEETVPPAVDPESTEETADPGETSGYPDVDPITEDGQSGIEEEEILPEDLAAEEPEEELIISDSPLGTERLLASSSRSGEPTDEQKAAATTMVLDAPYAVGWNNGNDTWFTYTAEETGYYSISTVGDCGGESGMISFFSSDNWYGQNPHVSGGWSVFFLKGHTYYLSAHTMIPDNVDNTFMDYWTDPSDGKKKYVAYTMTLSTAGFSGFTADCQTWNVGTNETKEISFPAVTSGRYFRPVEITVPMTGNYRFTMERTNAGDYMWPILLNNAGDVIAGPDNRDTYSVSGQGEIGADLTAGAKYYLVPSMLTEVDTTNVLFTGQPNDPMTSEYCTDGHRHAYAEQVVKASFTANGTWQEACPRCGRTGDTETIWKASAELERTVFAYTGEEIEPAVTVVAQSITLDPSEYTVTYANNIGPGKGTATVTLRNDWFDGSTTLEFQIGDSAERTDISEVELSGLVTPAEGEHPANLGQASYPSSHYNVSDICWVNVNDLAGGGYGSGMVIVGNMSGVVGGNAEYGLYEIEDAYENGTGLSSTDTFAAGETYAAIMEVTAQDGYRIQADEEFSILASLEIDGKFGSELTNPQIYAYQFYEEGNTDDVKSVLVSCEFTCENAGLIPQKTPVEEVKLTVTPPEAGKTSGTASLMVSVPGGEKYQITGSGTGWMSNYTFEAGGSYNAYVSLVADDGYAFTDPLKVTVAGGTLASVDEIYNSETMSAALLTIAVQIPDAPAEKQTQTITASNFTKTYGNAAFSIGAKTDGGGKLTYKSDKTAVAAVDGTGKVTIKGAGTAKITITAAETANYKAASKVITVTVNKAAQTVAASNFTKTYGNAAFSIGAKTNGGGKLTYKSDKTAVAAVDSAGKVTVKGAGTAKITISAAATANYKAASKVITITVNKAAQTVTASNFTKTYGNTAFSIGAKTNGGGKLTYKSDKTAVAVVDSAGKVTIKGAGTAKITISAAATANYKAASKVITVTVNKKAQTITASNVTKVVGNVAFSIGAKTNGGGKLTYKSSNTAVAAVSSAGKVTLKGAGTAKITINAAATANYKAASKTITMTVKKKPVVSYRTHVQTYGWQTWRKNGQMSGTSGEAKRLEGIEIKLSDLPYSGSIRYRTHVQSYGWQAWKTNGQMSGTSGEAKRLEGIQIYLTGELAKHYEVYYRVHAQSYGWLDYAKNGEMAGTSGLAKRLEGIEIVLVEKGGKAPGSTARPNVVGGGGSLPDNPYRK